MCKSLGRQSKNHYQRNSYISAVPLKRNAQGSANAKQKIFITVWHNSSADFWDDKHLENSKPLRTQKQQPLHNRLAHPCNGEAMPLKRDVQTNAKAQQTTTAKQSGTSLRWRRHVSKTVQISGKATQKPLPKELVYFCSAAEAECARQCERKTKK